MFALSTALAMWPNTTEGGQPAQAMWPALSGYEASLIGNAAILDSTWCWQPGKPTYDYPSHRPLANPSRGHRKNHRLDGQPFGLLGSRVDEQLVTWTTGQSLGLAASPLD